MTVRWHVLLRAGPLAAAAWLWAVPALAHDVQALITDGPPRQVTLTYGDGEPFAYEAYELRAPGAPLTDMPVQTGRTSELGVITLDAAPPAAPPLRLRAFSADGHGVDMALPAASTITSPATTPLTHASTTGERLARGLAGLSVIGALYGLWLSVQRRRRARPAEAPR